MNTFYAANVIAKLYLYIRQSWRKFSLAELIRRKVRFSVKGGEDGEGGGEGRWWVRNKSVFYRNAGRRGWRAKRINKFLSDEAVRYGIKLNSIRGNAAD